MSSNFSAWRRRKGAGSHKKKRFLREEIPQAGLRHEQRVGVHAQQLLCLEAGSSVLLAIGHRR